MPRLRSLVRPLNRHVLGNEHAAKFSQAIADNVDEWPLSVAFEKVRPDFEHGKSQYLARRVLGRVQMILILIIKIDNSPGFFDDTSDPMQYFLFTLCA